MFNKLFNKACTVIEQTLSSLRKIFVKFRYLNVDLSGSYLEKNGSIVCTDHSTIQIHDTYISTGVSLIAKHGGSLTISNSFIGRNCVIVACGNIEIGSNCQIAEMVVIRDQNHRFLSTEKPIAEQGFDVQSISIGSNVWLGAKATVLAGACIGDGTVIGAHSLVLGDIPSHSIAVGTPAIVKKSLLAS
jgi:acetyltransferase-like isoleucine patch superfamily enzyme